MILGECCFFMVEQVFPANGGVLLRHDANTQRTGVGERRPKGRENFLMFKFLSYQKI